MQPYALITPARNEGPYIERLLNSVTAQTHPPNCWVVVSDGSTDRTEELVSDYAARFSFLRLLRREPDPSRNFGSKVFAIREGIDLLSGVPYDFIGNIDADISFGPTYFAQLMTRFAEDPTLGLAGGLVYEKHTGEWEPMPTKVEWSVGGMVQLFRREAYERIGGYLPLQRGGVDMMAEVMVRMHGWKVQTFTDIEVHHHRKMGTEKGNQLEASFRRGVMEYVNGYHPLFQLARFVGRLPTRPYVLGSTCRTTGYFWAMARRYKLAVSPELANWMRHEQWMRMIGRPGSGRGAEAARD